MAESGRRSASGVWRTPTRAGCGCGCNEQLLASEHVCVYTGTPISLEMLFGGLVEIDHVLPYSKTLDDGFSNKVLCTVEANRTKGNRAPEDAWSGEALREIVERAERLFQEKCWRFQIGAMERFRKEDGYVARHLVDTQSLSRLEWEPGSTSTATTWSLIGRGPHPEELRDTINLSGCAHGTQHEQIRPRHRA